MFWKGKIERNTMQVFLDGFDASVESYLKKTVKIFPFYWFFEFLRHKNWAIFTIFVPAISYIVLKHCANFYKKPIQFATWKAQKTPIFGPIFRGDIDFFVIFDP